MHLLTLFSVALFTIPLVVLNQAIPLQKSVTLNYIPRSIVLSSETLEPLESADNKDEELVENSDFQDDDSEAAIDVLDSKDHLVYSLMHLHEREGEILVPCFGMWWPVGGGPPIYDYGGDYYGDYKKRRRSRKKKKTAKMKRKKN